MIYLKKFNEGTRCEYCDDEGREPSCHMCGKVYDYSDEYDDDDDDDDDDEALSRYHKEEHVDYSNIVADDDVMLKKSFNEFSKMLGIDPEWLSDYLHECFAFDLDQSEMPFSDDEFENILTKLENLKNNI